MVWKTIEISREKEERDMWLTERQLFSVTRSGQERHAAFQTEFFSMHTFAGVRLTR